MRAHPRPFGVQLTNLPATDSVMLPHGLRLEGLWVEGRWAWSLWQHGAVLLWDPQGKLGSYEVN